MNNYALLLKNGLTAWQTVFMIVVSEFSLVRLLQTLLAPWRRDIISPTGSLDEVIRIILDNLISRFVGFIVRTLTILVCLIALSFVLSLGLLIVLLLIVFGPLIAPLAPFPPSPPLFELEKSIPNASERLLKKYLDPSARKIYDRTQKPADFIALLIKERRFLFILNHLGLSPSVFSSILPVLSKIDPLPLLINAAQIAVAGKGERIAIPDLFYAFYLLNPEVQKFFENLKIKKQDIESLVSWEHAFYQSLHRPSVLLHPELYRTSGGIARLWAAGYTQALDKYSFEIQTSLAETLPLHFEAHKNLITEIETTLGRSGKHNVILVGEPGTGKRTVALGLARRAIFGKTVPSLAHHRVIELNIDALLAGTKTMGDIEERFISVLNEAVNAGNILLFIDNIERLFEQRPETIGAFDASSVLIPYLERADFQLIGVTTYDGYHKWIESNSTLSGNFEKVEVTEPSGDEVLKILQEVALYLESENKVLILWDALKEVESLSEKYLPEKKFPEKAIDLLDEAVSALVNKKKKSILAKEDVQAVVELKTKIPIGEVEVSEKEKLLNLEEKIHQRLINQEEAVLAISHALRRARANVIETNRPIGSFLFLGPTGVGKTECAKSLAEIYYGDEKRIIRFDMSEYQELGSISRFIGGKIGEPGFLTSKVRENPFSLVLLDEIEKAHPNILNLFLQVLDEGKITDSQGRAVDFKNTIIIATSNAGAEWIREQVQTGKIIEKKQFIDYLLKRGYFRPEFLNRFDAVVAFKPLGVAELCKIVDLMVLKIQKELEKKQIKIQIAPKAREKLAQIGFDPEFGARALRRVIQDKAENEIAKQILEDKLKPGLTFVIKEDMI